MGIYGNSQPDNTTVQLKKRVATTYEEVKSRPGYEVDKMKSERLTTSSVPSCAMDLAYDYNQIGILATDNTFAVRVSDLVRDKDDSETTKILNKLANNSGYITDEYKPLGHREEASVTAKTCYNGKDSTFWSKGSNA